MRQGKKEESAPTEKAVFSEREDKAGDQKELETEVENAHASGDGALKRSDKEQAASSKNEEKGNSNY